MVKALYLPVVISFSFLCSGLLSLFGGWTQALSTLLILLALDYITGLMVAGIFHKSRKSDSGSLSSVAGLKGIAKKIATLILVIVAYQMDKLLVTTIIKDAVCIALCVNEIISLLENLGLMGVKYPKIIEKALDILKDRVDDDTNAFNN